MVDVAGERGRLPGSRPADAARLPRGRHDLPREFIASTQRERLIDAMARVVAQKGYASASLTEVCATAGVSTRAFYEHFSDKEACLLAAFDLGIGLMQRAVAEAFAQPELWPQRIHRGLETLLRILATEPAFASLAVVEVLAAGAKARERRQMLVEGYIGFFAEVPRRPGAPEVPDGVVEAVINGVYGVIFDLVSTGRAAELPDRLPGLTYFVLVPFLGPVVAARVARGS
ncbi:TetR/AcrR family transcriptional regulator [Actinoplanes sp. NPDC051859]|uniref:TetR/AcrR family transcriptional regulator n=1 Tax=Actinoplanes sp. NPDC051859 TaxID=3363909 RepID=UPI0037ADD36D